LIDPARLLVGIADFRNRFRLRLFEPAPQGVRYAIQKIDGVGSSWLPGPVTKAWLSMTEGDDD
jgi:hypothetical protein